jgi:hypothetical protein
MLLDIFSTCFGVTFVGLALYCLYLRGANMILTKQNKTLEVEQAMADANLRQLAAKVKDMQQPYIIHYSDEGILKLAGMINNKVKMLYDAQQKADLNRMD